MNRFTRWGLVLALLPLAACSSHRRAEALASTAPPAPEPALSAADTTFANQASVGNLFEIQSSQPALTQARRPGIKKFAQQMIDQHGQAEQQLTTIASSKGVTVPTELDQTHAQPIADMSKLNGPRFDRAYLHAQTVAHQATVKTFQTEIADGTDPELKAFAQQTLPVIQEHLKEVQSLGGR